MGCWDSRGPEAFGGVCEHAYAQISIGLCLKRLGGCLWGAGGEGATGNDFQRTDSRCGVWSGPPALAWPPRVALCPCRVPPCAKSSKGTQNLLTSSFLRSSVRAAPVGEAQRNQSQGAVVGVASLHTSSAPAGHMWTLAPACSHPRRVDTLQEEQLSRGRAPTPTKEACVWAWAQLSVLLCVVRGCAVCVYTFVAVCAVCMWAAQGSLQQPGSGLRLAGLSSCQARD